MITENDLKTAIAECQGVRNPDASTCIKLAAFYTIKREMFGEEKNAEQKYSYSPPPDSSVIQVDGDSEFERAIDGREQAAIFPVLDELMSTIKIIHPRLYTAVMEKLS